MALLAFPARTMMSSKCFTSDSRPSVLIWNSNCWPGGEGAFRFNFATPQPILAEMVERLADALNHRLPG